MGLDIMLFKISKTDFDETKLYDIKELEESSLTLIPHYENSNNTILSQQFIDDFTQSININSWYFSPEKLYKIFKEKYPQLYNNYEDDTFEPTMHYSSSNAEYQEYKFVDDAYSTTPYDKRPYIEFKAYSFHELKEKYLFQQVTPHYAFKTTEIDYQRKGLNETGWSLLPENCSYCTDKEVVEKLVNEGGLSESFLENWIDGQTALHPWW